MSAATNSRDFLSAYVPTGHPCGNSLMSRDGYRVSFNPSPGMGFSTFAADDGGAETALIVDGEYLILNGDFREEYERCETLDDCLRFFASRPDLVSTWSTSVEAVLARINEVKP